MQFVHPFFLWALLALLIPIIIHLFNFRRFKKVYFTNVKFLKEVKEETASRSRLKHWLVLLSRLAFVAFLVLAFAQPFLPKNENEVVTGSRAVSIFIDNSFSMNAQSEDVSLFEKSKQKAREIVSAYGPEDKFQIITHDLEGKHQRLINKEAVEAAIEEITVSPNVASLSNAHSRQLQVLEKSNAAQSNLFYISDFQKSIVDLKTDTSFNYYFVPLQSVNQQNVFVDSCWFSNPVQLLNQTNKMLVRLSNTGNAKVENARMELKINDEVKAIKNFSIPPKTVKTDTISFRIGEPGWHLSELSITDYPINFDDNYFFSFYLPEKIKVLSINEGNSSKYLNALFKEQDQMDLSNQSISNVDYSSINEFQLIVLNELKKVPSGLTYQLQQYLADGGSLLVFPNINLDKPSYNEFSQALKVNNYEELVQNPRSVNYINTYQEIFSDVFEKIPRNIDLPNASSSYNLSRYSSTNEEVLLRFNDQRSFLGKYNYKGGKIYLSSVPINSKYSNISAHAVFVPMILKMVIAGGNISQLAYTIGEEQFIEADNTKRNAEAVYKLRGQEQEFIPGQKAFGSKVNLSLNNQLKKAGIYELRTDDVPAMAYYGFNFNRKESVLEYLNLNQLKNLFAGDHINFIENFNTNISQVVGEIDKGVVLWKLCIILALIFLALEVLFLRFLPG